MCNLCLSIIAKIDPGFSRFANICGFKRRRGCFFLELLANSFLCKVRLFSFSAVPDSLRCFFHAKPARLHAERFCFFFVRGQPGECMVLLENMVS